MENDVILNLVRTSHLRDSMDTMKKILEKRCEIESRTNLPLAKLGGAAKVGGITTLFEPRGNCFKSFLNLEAFGVKSSSFGEPEVLFNASFTVRGDGAYAE